MTIKKFFDLSHLKYLQKALTGAVNYWSLSSSITEVRRFIFIESKKKFKMDTNFRNNSGNNETALRI